MLEQYKNFYFVGIGGIGMSALARWFGSKSFFVAGYDRTPSSLTDQLVNEGMEITFDESVAAIPEKIIREKEQTLVVYTAAIPQGHPQMDYFLKKSYAIKKRAQVLGWIAGDFYTVAVAGTHGKTTISSMIAHILTHSGKGCTAFLGGILQNYNNNLLLSKQSDEDTIVVVEADEYDRSFLFLEPDIEVISFIDTDHLDIYGDQTQIIEAFDEFVKKIRPNGRLFIKNDLDLGSIRQKKDIAVHYYGLKGNEARAVNIQNMGRKFGFDYYNQEIRVDQVALQVPGSHNVENAIAAISVSLSLGVTPGQIREALADYRGVKRRFEYVVEGSEKVYIDDYAHHPREIEAVLKAAKQIYPEKKVTAIFQPHLYSRTKDLQEEFAKSLSLADEVILLDIYPARELPIEGVSSEIILNKIKCSHKVWIRKEQLIEELNKRKLEVVLTMGAGDIDRWVEKIREIMLKQ